jgi:dolichyl-phosphate beta-glucosyltransferase
MTSTSQRVLMVARPSRNNLAIKLSIIIPAYNEAYRLPVALDALRHRVNSSSTEIIVVDDGSTDETVIAARRAGEWAKYLVVIEHSRNQGKGAAVRTGVAAARGDVIAFIDADNATDLSALAPMIAALGPNVAAVFGSRHAPGSNVTGAPAIRGLMGRAFNHVVQIAAGTSIRDTQCGAKVFHAPAARVAFASAGIDGFAFDVEILRRLLAMGLNVVEYPVRWHYVHGTKIRLTTPLKMLSDIGRLRLSKTAGMPLYIDTLYSPELALTVDAFSSGAPTNGQPCRIAVLSDQLLEVQAQLDALGLPSRPRRSRSWPDFLGQS